MGRILAIDYGRRRCGLAATDPLRLVATGVDTVASARLIDAVKAYMAQNEVDFIVVGQPRDMRGRDSESMTWLRPAIARLQRELPAMEIVFFDERFTSVLAHRAMLDGGMKKSQRRDKAVVDTMAAVIILNDYLESRAYAERQGAR